MGRPNEIGFRDCGWRQSARETGERRVEELIKSIVTRRFRLPNLMDRGWLPFSLNRLSFGGRQRWVLGNRGRPSSNLIYARACRRDHILGHAPSSSIVTKIKQGICTHPAHRALIYINAVSGEVSKRFWHLARPIRKSTTFWGELMRTCISSVEARKSPLGFLFLTSQPR